MNIINWNDFIETGISDCTKGAITVGVFDGVHIGHRELVRRIRNFAVCEQEVESIVFTFTNNPTEFFDPKGFLGNISTLRQKCDNFMALGVHHIVLIDFSAEFSKLTGSNFFSIIGENVEIKLVCLGKNFHCGKDNDTNSKRVKELLKPKNIIVDIVDQVPYKHDAVSSTRIRKALHAGNIRDANEMLGKHYELDLRDGFDKKRQILPGSGRYKIKTVEGKERIMEIRTENDEIIFPDHRIDSENIKKIQFIDTL